jgi:phosphoenolpyruvate synthase/pyruvate phosphate dikinase
VDRPEPSPSFPVPAADDGDEHVYVSVGHGQMMTDPMRPLGLSMWQMTAAIPMHEAGGRLWVDVTERLASPASRPGLLGVFGRGDPLLRDALETIVERGDLPPTSDEGPAAPPPVAPAGPDDIDPGLVPELIARTDASVAALARDIGAISGPALFHFIRDDLQVLKRLLFEPQSHQVVMAGMEALWWLNDHLREWLGERSAADVLTQSVPHNVTSEMGLALLDVADAIRPHPEVVAFLERADDDGFLAALDGLAGGPEARAAIEAWLARYGMRCVGEIDITRPRWRERPATLLPVILGHVRTEEPGARARRFEAGRQAAAAKEEDILRRLRGLPDGARKAEEAKRTIDRLRACIGYREHPKFGIVRRYFLYKQALLREADQLVRSGALPEEEDIYFLTFDELEGVVGEGQVDAALIDERKAAFRSYGELTPPRVLTSRGEALTGAYRRDDVPPGALTGLAVSAGIVEGRARVVLDLAEAEVEPGDILVTPHTDPSWTPLFVAVAGLVTEVGGLMTHGAVIAREYGLPAVVGVERATALIPDGQRIRVHGTEGYVELLG